MADGEHSSADNMKKGRGISHGYKTVGMGLKGEDKHPEITGEDPMRKGPGRPAKGENSFKVVGPSVDQEGGKKE